MELRQDPHGFAALPAPRMCCAAPLALACGRGSGLWLVWHGGFCVFTRLCFQCFQPHRLQQPEFCCHLENAFLDTQVAVSGSCVSVSCVLWDTQLAEAKLQSPVRAGSDSGTMSVALWGSHKGGCSARVGMLLLTASSHSWVGGY